MIADVATFQRQFEKASRLPSSDDVINEFIETAVEISQRLDALVSKTKVVAQKRPLVMPIPNNYKLLITRLIDRTSSKRVEWVSRSANTFSIHFDKYSLQIFQYSVDEYGRNENGIAFMLLNDAGDAIDNFGLDEGDKDFKIAEELFQLARRSALKIDEAIQKLAEMLGPDDVTQSQPTKGCRTEPVDDDDTPF